MKMVSQCNIWTCVEAIWSKAGIVKSAFYRMTTEDGSLPVRQWFIFCFVFFSRFVRRIRFLRLNSKLFRLVPTTKTKMTQGLCQIKKDFNWIFLNFTWRRHRPISDAFFFQDLTSSENIIISKRKYNEMLPKADTQSCQDKELIRRQGRPKLCKISVHHRTK